MNSIKIVIAVAAFFSFSACASAQTAIERRFIGDVELSFPTFTENNDASAATVDNSVWNAFLKTYLEESADGVNRVRYGDVTDQDAAALGGYITALEATNVAGLSSDEQLAFWINLYNAVTVGVILDHYPVSSIRKIKSGPFDFKGPWDDKRVNVSSEVLSLNDIEHDIIRAIYDDPRIHYAVNCASVGCPNLRTTAYEAANIDSALDEQARAFINHPRGVSVDARGRVEASKIFAWYAEDFGENDREILDHIRNYAAAELQASLDGAEKIQRYAYDWALNDATAP